MTEQPDRKDFDAWCAHVEEQRRMGDMVVGCMLGYGFAVERANPREVGCLPYTAALRVQAAVVTIGFVLFDHNTDSDVVIRTMTVLPEVERSKGYGRYAIEQVLAWLRMTEGDTTIRATQISNIRSEHFWELCGFLRAPEPNPCNDFVRRV